MVRKTDKNLETARELKKKLSSEVNMDRMILFGSRVSGDYTPESDYDFIVVSEDFEGRPWYKRPTKLYLMWDHDVPVEILCYTPKEYEKKITQPTVVAEASKSGITI